jgi:hypothetical protein
MGRGPRGGERERREAVASARSWSWSSGGGEGEAVVGGGKCCHIHPARLSGCRGCSVFRFYGLLSWQAGTTGVRWLSGGDCVELVLFLRFRFFFSLFLSFWSTWKKKDVLLFRLVNYSFLMTIFCYMAREVN